MGLESITLSEISQRETKLCYHLYVESKKKLVNITQKKHMSTIRLIFRCSQQIYSTVPKLEIMHRAISRHLDKDVVLYP